MDILGPTTLSTVGYSDIVYQDLQVLAHGIQSSREGMMLDAVSRWKSGQVKCLNSALFGL